MTQEYLDRDTGTAFATAAGLVNHYIERFGQIISSATGTEVRFLPLNEEGFTPIRRGSATVGINVLEAQGILVFVSRIMTVPAENTEACFRFLLELNYTGTSEASFAIEKASRTICLRSSRAIAGLDYDEFEEMLHSIATVADEWDDRLMEMFS